MQNTFAVAVRKRLNDLFEEAFSEVLFETATSTHIVQQVTSSTDFNNEQEVLVCLEVLVEAHDVFVACALQHDDLLHDLLGLRLV